MHAGYIFSFPFFSNSIFFLLICPCWIVFFLLLLRLKSRFLLDFVTFTENIIMLMCYGLRIYGYMVTRRILLGKLFFWYVMLVPILQSNSCKCNKLESKHTRWLLFCFFSFCEHRRLEKVNKTIGEKKNEIHFHAEHYNMEINLAIVL